MAAKGLTCRAAQELADYLNDYIHCSVEKDHLGGWIVEVRLEELEGHTNVLVASIIDARLERE